MLVCLTDGHAQIILRAATLREKLQIKLSTSPSHSILAPGQPVPALTLSFQAPDRVALSHWYDSNPEKSRRKRNSNPGSSALEADALTTRPTRRCSKQSTQRDSVAFGTRSPHSRLTHLPRGHLGSRRDYGFTQQKHTCHRTDVLTCFHEIHQVRYCKRSKAEACLLAR